MILTKHRVAHEGLSTLTVYPLRRKLRERRKCPGDMNQQQTMVCKKYLLLSCWQIPEIYNTTFMSIMSSVILFSAALKYFIQMLLSVG